MTQIGRWPQMGQKKWSPLRLLLALLAAVLALPPHVDLAAATALAEGGAVIYVDDSTVGGANDGSSWANAFTDLQDALNAAQAGDEIRIGQGVYKPAPPGGDRAISFNLVSGVVMQGGYAGFGAPDPDAVDFEKFETVLSGDLNGDDSPAPASSMDNSTHVVKAAGVNSATILRGLVIERGYAYFATLECYGAPGETSQGGGLWCVGADFLMEDCTIRSNIASCSGGGLWYSGGSAVFVRCTFAGNRAGTNSDYNSGGAVSAQGNISFVDSRFVGNSAYGAGAASVIGATFRRCLFQQNHVYEIAGAIDGDDLAIVDCVFDANFSGTFVGGVIVSNSVISNCVFTRHSAICGPILGCAIRTTGNTLIVNSVFTGNGAPTIKVGGQANSITNCTIIGNQYCDGGVQVSSGHAAIANCIIWDNGESTPITDVNQVIVGLNGSVAIERSVIQGWTGSFGGTGNHGNDPRFVDADGPDNIYGTADDDPRLRPNSPCIDSGDSALLPPDQFDLDEDGDFTEPLPIDLDGLPRVVGASVDIGAFEFQGVPCRADIDGSGTVDVNDLLAIINAWGPCTPGQQCNSDLDLSGQIDVSDLLAVVLAWGGCP